MIEFKWLILPFQVSSRGEGRTVFDLEKSENARTGLFADPSEEKVRMRLETRVKP
jgi:hypothetical protein